MAEWREKDLGGHGRQQEVFGKVGYRLWVSVCGCVSCFYIQMGTHVSVGIVETAF